MIGHCEFCSSRESLVSSVSESPSSDFRRLRRIGNGLFFQVFLAGDIVYDAGNGDGWVDVGRRTGISKIVELFGS